MSPGNRRFDSTALRILGLIALSTVAVWVALSACRKGNEGKRRLMHCRLQELLLVGLPLQTLRLTGHEYPPTRALRAKRSTAAAWAPTEAA
jgi:hypothetical protein